ncbi:MAG TPA: N-acetylglucosamine-6-phosphate deacetylase [Acidimicrobiia bacterium]|nr:N-acetylglucosamine-6-phosphate deacetylase [Acidimicrobiia bacterium]
MITLRGGKALTPDGLVQTDVTATEGRLVLGAVDGSRIIDVTGSTIIPGLIDIQTNGGCGHDFTSDPESIWEVGRRLPETGVTSFVPTIVSGPFEVTDRAIEVLKAGPPPGYVGADVLGAHIEGPWISAEWRGAHNADYLRLPDAAQAGHWAESGVVRMVTIAPELEGAEETAAKLDAAGVVVAAGHTGAGYDMAIAALQGPWSAVTHLFNQMSQFRHRDPGMVGAALTSTRPCGLIVDGLHSHPGALRLAWQLLGPDRLILVTDSMQATGLGPGTYLLGDQEVTVGDDGPRTGQGKLAGSTLTMERAVANLTAWTDASFAQAVRCATLTPATLLSVTDRGVIRTGRRADVTVLDHDLNVVITIVSGMLAYDRGTT